MTINYIHRQLHPPSTLWYIIINIIKRLPSSPRPIYTSLCSSAFTTLPEILLITIDCLIYWQRIKLPRWRSLLYEGYSYRLDVYRLLISVYHLHQIATLLALASNCRRGDDWHNLMSFFDLPQTLYGRSEKVRSSNKAAPANCHTQMTFDSIISILSTFIHNSHHFFILYYLFIGRIQIHSSVGRRK